MTTYAARDLVRLPGLLSLSRLPFAIAFAFLVDRPLWAVGVLLLSGLSDVLDGWVARRFGSATTTGAVLDAVMDKVFVAVVVVALVVSHALTVGQAVLLGIRDIGELAIGTHLALGGRARLTRPHPPRLAGKVTTLLQYVVAIVALFHSRYVSALVLLAAACGAIATVVYWTREAGERRSSLPMSRAGR